MRWLSTSVRHPSVVRPKVIISNTKRDWPKVTIWKLALLILLSHSDPFQATSAWGDIMILNTKYVQILIRPYVRLGVRSQLLSTEQTVVSSPVLSVVVNKLRRPELVHNNPPLLCRRRKSLAGSGPASFHSAMIWLVISMSFIWLFVIRGSRKTEQTFTCTIIGT